MNSKVKQAFLLTIPPHHCDLHYCLIALEKDMIQLKDICKENWHEALDLPTGEDHKKFVASNLYSIAQAQFYPGQKSYGIYLGDRMIGYALCGVNHGFDRNPGTEFWICRLMIAEGERFKGYGKEATKLIINLAHDMGFDKVYLSTEEENAKGIAFYQSLGFRLNGEMLDDEVILCYQL